MISLINYLAQAVKFLVLSLFQSNQMIKNFQLKEIMFLSLMILNQKFRLWHLELRGIKFQLRKKLII